MWDGNRPLLTVLLSFKMTIWLILLVFEHQLNARHWNSDKNPCSPRVCRLGYQRVTGEPLYRVVRDCLPEEVTVELKLKDEELAV